MNIKLNEKCVVKIRDGRVCVLIEDCNSFGLFDKKGIAESKSCITHLSSYNGAKCDGCFDGCRRYDIVAIKKFDEQIEAIRAIMTNRDITYWDWEERKIEVGDIVKVTDTGKQYRIYDGWIKANAPDEAMRFAYGISLNGFCNCRFEVIKHAPHERNGVELYLIKNLDRYGMCFLIGEGGIIKVNEYAD